MPWKAGGALLQEVFHKWQEVELTMSQCPGKRAGHCYLADQFVEIGPFVISLNALESGRVIVTVTVEEIQQAVAVSMPWKAGESLLQTPFWRPVALRLVSPESLTSDGLSAFARPASVQ